MTGWKACRSFLLQGCNITESVSRWWNNIIDRDLWIICSDSRLWLYIRKIIKSHNFLESKTYETGNRELHDNERDRCPHRVWRKRLLIFTIMQCARSGSIREKSPERKNSLPSRRTRLSHDIYFAERLSCAKPLESSCRRLGLVSRELVPAEHFILFGTPIVLGYAYVLVTINIFIARGMGQIHDIQRDRFAAPKTYNMYLYECLLLNGC